MEVENKPSSHIKYGNRIQVTIVRGSECPAPLPPAPGLPQDGSSPLATAGCPQPPFRHRRPLRLQAGTVFPSPPCLPLRMLSRSVWLGWMDGRAGQWLARWLDCPFQFG